jgi:predicted nucleic acid-binding protein
MRVECFLDTNILVYAVSAAPADAAKKEKALELIERADFGLSAQVLQEFYVTVTRKIAKPLTPDSAVALIEEFKVFPTVQVDYALIVSGIEVSLAYGISYWDGTIVAAAGELGAPVLMTEDLNDGQSYGAVRVVNPFRDVSRPDRVHEP